jgi:histone H3/H4
MIRRASEGRMDRMAKKKARKAGGRKGTSEAMIISKARVKAAVKKCNVGSEFYGALEGSVRDLIARAEQRALGNKRKTLRAADV